MAGEDNIIGKGFDARPDAINRDGRPKGSRNRSTIVRELIDALADGHADRTKFEVATLAVLSKAMSGDIQAWEKLADSAFGKVSDKTEVTNPDGSLTPQSITVKVVTKKE